jgi:hypothetical protein
MDRGTTLLDEASRLIAASGCSHSPLAVHRRGTPPPPQRSVSGADDVVPPGLVAVSKAKAAAAPAAAASAVSAAVPASDMRAIGVAFLHDEAVTRDLGALCDVLRERELARLAEAAEMLEAEARIRRDYAATLREQLTQVDTQRRRLLSQYATVLAGGPTAAAGAARTDDDATSSLSDGNNVNNGSRAAAAAAAAAVAQNRSFAQFNTSFDSSPRRGAASAVGAAAPAQPAWQSQGSTLGATVRNAGAASIAGSGRGNGGGSGAGPASASPSKNVSLRQRMAASFPGVSFGALTTASAATRYATFWSVTASQP